MSLEFRSKPISMDRSILILALIIYSMGCTYFGKISHNRSAFAADNLNVGHIVEFVRDRLKCNCVDQNSKMNMSH